MQRKVLLGAVAVIIFLAYVWAMRNTRYFFFNISLPTSAGFEVHFGAMIFEEWLMAALYALVFALLIGVIYKRAWLPLSLAIGALQLVIIALQHRGLSCGHLKWLADCMQSYARETFILPLLTWPVARIAGYIRAL